MKIRKLQQLTCLRCGKTWIPRIKDVRQCPNCKSAKWDVPPKVKKSVSGKPKKQTQTTVKELTRVKCEDIP